MKNIFKIFRRDLKGLITNFFAFVIAGGLILLPALYAWFNIYANWDPYGSTGNVKIAVVNDDEGWTDGFGAYSNKGEDVIENLRKKDTIGWVFLESDTKAVEGVKSGEYYAALIIDRGFTYSMYNGVLDNLQNPKITYYVNDKKNAVATKITDSAAGSVQTSLNKTYIEVVAEKVFEETNDISETLKEKDAVGNFISKIENISDNLKSYDKMIDTFVKANENLADSTANASAGLKKGQKKISEGVNKLEKGQKSLASTKTSFQDYSNDVNATMSKISGTLSNISKEIEAAGLDKEIDTLSDDIKNIKEDAQVLSKELDTLYSDVEKIALHSDNSKLTGTLSAILNMKNMTKNMAKGIDLSSTADMTKDLIENTQDALNAYSKTVDQLKKMYTNQVVPQVSELIDNMSDTLESVQKLLLSLSGTADNMNSVFKGVVSTLDTLNMSMEELKDVINKTDEKLAEFLETVKDKSEQEQIDIILGFLGGNPEELGTFFSEPVQTDDIYVYGIENYGSGVAPFYTTLAIWVGMTILVSLLKVHASTEGLENVKPHELFFGRYLLFFVLSQIQTFIIVIGNLFVFKIQCLDKFAFWGAAAMASLTFSLLVYSLTIAFGDIGKAVAVISMILQIAGSGGTYPIEALPAFFRGVYIFFPFPYAINAMRECIGGMYENDYYVCLSQLVIFCVASLIIGLVIRIPFIKLNHFIEERMEDTEML